MNSELKTNMLNIKYFRERKQVSREKNQTIEWHELDGVKVPFASAQLMLLTKQTLREKDEIDRLYLRQILGI